MESHAALVNLQNNMLQPAYHNLPLADVAEALESQLASRRPTINAALARPSPTLHTVVASLLNENLVLAAGAPGSRGGSRRGAGIGRQGRTRHYSRAVQDTGGAPHKTHGPRAAWLAIMQRLGQPVGLQ